MCLAGMGALEHFVVWAQIVTCLSLSTSPSKLRIRKHLRSVRIRMPLRLVSSNGSQRHFGRLRFRAIGASGSGLFGLCKLPWHFVLGAGPFGAQQLAGRINIAAGSVTNKFCNSPHSLNPGALNPTKARSPQPNPSRYKSFAPVCLLQPGLRCNDGTRRRGIRNAVLRSLRFRVWGSGLWGVRWQGCWWLGWCAIYLVCGFFVPAELIRHRDPANLNLNCFCHALRP